MFLIITTKNINHEGDQRSRDFPGHGYPAWSEEVSVVEKFFPDEVEKFKKRIAALESDRFAKYTAYKAEKVIVTTTTEINIDGLS